MTPEQFCYWLKGFFELSESYSPVNVLEKPQVEEIKNHLNKVFNREKPFPLMNIIDFNFSNYPQHSC